MPHPIGLQERFSKREQEPVCVSRHHGYHRQLECCLLLRHSTSTLQEDCSFTDPTLSFSGLSTYKRNVGSLQGVLDRLVSDSRSVLYSCELQQVLHS